MVIHNRIDDRDLDLALGRMYRGLNVGVHKTLGFTLGFTFWVTSGLRPRRAMQGHSLALAFLRHPNLRITG
jgi:hypothetical protein